jgi:hypothetical protein
MATFAVINNGVVENCIVANSKAEAEEASEGLTCIEYFLVTPGWNYSDGVFSPPIAGE